MSNSLKMSDALFAAAEVVVKMGKKVGVDVKLVDLYKDENIKQLALIAGACRGLV